MEETIKVLFTGDFFGGNRISRLIEAEDFSAIFKDFTLIVKESDIAVTNLESPLTEATKPIEKTGPAIKSSLKTAEALKFAGFNLIALANNHILDYGEIGLKDTLACLRKLKIEYTGAGENLNQASTISYKFVKGKSLAFINITENEWSTTFNEKPGANPLNPIANYYSIRTAKAKADFVFVIAHGGHELYSLPSPRIREIYRFFIDSGADAVIGHHSHFVSGMEVYNKGLIFYGLGNFVFDEPEKRNPLWFKGIAVQILLTGKIKNYTLIPFSQNESILGVKLLFGIEKEKVLNDIKRLSEIIIDDRLLESEFKHFCKRARRVYGYYLEPHSNRYLYALQYWGILPSFLNRRKKLLYKNLIMCESHRDVFVNILANEDRTT
jgi:hypothetical protein